MEVDQIFARTSSGGEDRFWAAAWYEKAEPTGIFSSKNFAAIKSVYPNPARDQFYIKSATELLSLRDMTGRTIDAQVSSLNNETLKISLPSGNAGLYFAAAKLLIDNGAKLNLKDAQGRTALEIAKEHRSDHIVMLLIDK